jgi:hypothetical protein
MRTSVADDKAFIDRVIDSSLLETSIDFIIERFTIEDIYGRDALEEWALENEFTRNSRVEELEDNLEALKEENNRLLIQLHSLNE